MAAHRIADLSSESVRLFPHRSVTPAAWFTSFEFFKAKKTYLLHDFSNVWIQFAVFNSAGSNLFRLQHLARCWASIAPRSTCFVVDLEVHFDQSVAPGLSFGPIMKLLISQSLKLMVTYMYMCIFCLYIYIYLCIILYMWRIQKAEGRNDLPMLREWPKEGRKDRPLSGRKEVA